MAIQTLGVKPVAASVAAAVRFVRSPLKVPAWAVALIVVMAALYGYVAGRQNPLHRYVPYVGYPLVLDTTTGRSCYSSIPKPTDDSALAPDAGSPSADGAAPSGPSIPVCGK
jgi:hypothetical protein